MGPALAAPAARRRPQRPQPPRLACPKTSSSLAPLRTAAQVAVIIPAAPAAQLPLDGLLDGESEIAVGACRDTSSIMHLMIPRLVPPLAGYQHLFLR
jgi:hypothetical protein